MWRVHKEFLAMSAIWKLGLFEKIDNESAVCKKCKRQLQTKGASTKGLIVHLGLHPEEKAQFEEARREPVATGSLERFFMVIFN